MLARSPTLRALQNQWKEIKEELAAPPPSQKGGFCIGEFDICSGFALLRAALRTVCGLADRRLIIRVRVTNW